MKSCKQQYWRPDDGPVLNKNVLNGPWLKKKCEKNPADHYICFDFLIFHLDSVNELGKGSRFACHSTPLFANLIRRRTKLCVVYCGEQAGGEHKHREQARERKRGKMGDEALES